MLLELGKTRMDPSFGSTNVIFQNQNFFRSTDCSWGRRIHMAFGNASKKTHKELEEATSIDDGDPVEFGWDSQGLFDVLENLHIVGGCCGTDTRHTEEFVKRSLSKFERNV